MRLWDSLSQEIEYMLLLIAAPAPTSFANASSSASMIAFSTSRAVSYLVTRHTIHETATLAVLTRHGNVMLESSARYSHAETYGCRKDIDNEVRCV